MYLQSTFNKFLNMCETQKYADYRNKWINAVIKKQLFLCLQYVITCCSRVKIEARFKFVQSWTNGLTSFLWPNFLKFLITVELHTLKPDFIKNIKTKS